MTPTRELTPSLPAPSLPALPLPVGSEPFVAVGAAPRVAARDRRLELYLQRALLVIIALVAIPYGTAAPWWEALFECSLFALGIVWIFHQAFVANRSTEFDVTARADWTNARALFWPWLALLAFATAQTLPVWFARQTVESAGSAYVLSADPFETRRFVLKLLALVLAGWLLRWGVARDEKRLRALVWLVIGVGLASAVFALARQALQRPGAFFVLPMLQAGTGYGQFINHNHFAYLMEMTWGLLSGLALGARNRRSLVFYLTTGAIAWLALVLSNSRGGIYSMLGQLCLFAALWSRVRNQPVVASPIEAEPATDAATEESTPNPRKGLPVARMGVLACLLTVVVIGVVWVGGDALATRFELLPRELDGAQSNPRLQVRRIEMWRATWQLIKAHPLTGSGFGAFEPAVTEHYDASGNWTLREAHNDYLELLASGGLIGAALVAWFGFVFVRQARRQLRAPDAFRRAACGGALIGLCGVALHSLVDFGLQLTTNALICAALIVIATVAVGQRTEAQPNGSKGLGSTA